MKPLLENQHEQAAASLRRKVGVLREGVIRMLEVHMRRADQETSGPWREHGTEALNALRQADVAFEDAQRNGDGIVEQTNSLSELIVETGAAKLASAWKKQPQGRTEVGPIFATALARVLTSHAANLVSILETARQQLAQTLSLANAVVRNQVEATEPLPKLPALPVFDPSRVTSGLLLRMPPVLSWLGTSLLRSYAQWRLEGPLREPLGRFFNQHRQLLRQWLRKSLSELNEAFTAQAGPLRAQLEARLSSPASVSSADSMEADLLRLREWQA